MDPLVSVLMTSYNREKYIAEAIESVLASSYKHFELIIVDDVSADATVSIARSYESRDDRVRVYVNEKNLGDYFNRNKAASYATGKYLKYLDSDDVIYPYSLAMMVDALENNPSAAFAAEQVEVDISRPYPFLVTPSWVMHNHLLNKSIIGAGPSGTIIRKDVFDELGGFSVKRYLGDLELWLRISMKYPIVLLQPSLVWWRRHDDQEMAKEQKDDTVMISKYLLHRVFITSAMIPLNNEEKILALNKLNRRHIVNIVKIFFRRYNIKESIRLFKQSKMSFSELIKSVFH
jgi:glycosyltransferase involved in cell wall biosynthesis